MPSTKNLQLRKNRKGIGCRAGGDRRDLFFEFIKPSKCFHLSPLFQAELMDQAREARQGASILGRELRGA
jgi:hypothetical protein